MMLATHLSGHWWPDVVLVGIMIALFIIVLRMR